MEGVEGHSDDEGGFRIVGMGSSIEEFGDWEADSRMRLSRSLDAVSGCLKSRCVLCIGAVGCDVGLSKVSENLI